MEHVLGLSGRRPSSRAFTLVEMLVVIAVIAILAALLMAGFTGLVFASARLVLPESWSLLLGLAVAFGTQVWSTASRGVWSHTWELLLLGVVVYHLLSNAVRGSRLSGMLLSTALAWAYVTRPTASISLGKTLTPPEMIMSLARSER